MTDMTLKRGYKDIMGTWTSRTPNLVNVIWLLWVGKNCLLSFSTHVLSTLAIKEHVKMENFTKKRSLRNALSSMGEISMNKVGKSTKATFFNLFQCMCFPSPKKPPQAMHSTPIPWISCVCGSNDSLQYFLDLLIKNEASRL